MHRCLRLLILCSLVGCDEATAPAAPDAQQPLLRSCTASQQATLRSSLQSRLGARLSELAQQYQVTATRFSLELELGAGPRLSRVRVVDPPRVSGRLADALASEAPSWPLPPGMDFDRCVVVLEPELARERPIPLGEAQRLRYQPMVFIRGTEPPDAGAR